jgi:hypothetical protein
MGAFIREPLVRPILIPDLKAGPCILILSIANITHSLALNFPDVLTNNASRLTESGGQFRLPCFVPAGSAICLKAYMSELFESAIGQQGEGSS